MLQFSDVDSKVYISEIILIDVDDNINIFCGGDDDTDGSVVMIIILSLFQITMPATMRIHVSATSYFLALLCVYLQCKQLIHGGVSVLIGMGIFL